MRQVYRMLLLSDLFQGKRVKLRFVEIRND